MFAVSLVAAPGALDRSHVEAVRDAFGGGDAAWLSGGEAAEFAIPARPPQFAHVAGEMRMLGVDVNLLPAKGRRKRLLLADMDSTMIGQECIDELADLAGAGGEVAAVTAAAMRGELDFEAALEARLALLEGLEEGAVDRVIAERLTLTPGGAALVATMRAQGARCVLVSGGFTAFTGWVAGRLGFDAHRANVLEVAGGRLLGRARRPYLGREAKVAALEEECAALGIGPEAALAVGDGANDLGMIGRAGLGVALHAKPVVAERADARVDHGDLSALLYLQGYRREEFAA
ncbi:phosphoserine phosphatase [Hasllibacter halocynthiae]|uniref:Phosphoserine phosphatase n=1 Tax=Hasllibacter halocynthiae TaxID=595589 RepID=A0A2T0X1P8_9RHOB|nr:phosphoserine phosphatase SerB [Hasllibacter halocynthiae]PRY92868.1 phosphoserine phosphatase [Hasllibacter halocynthiae]